MSNNALKALLRGPVAFLGVSQIPESMTPQPLLTKVVDHQFWQVFSSLILLFAALGGKN